ncbi:MAG TPA: hypothetical protein VNO30_29250 [Kofleriaceae bacterium]|nr:hypothetical protein [Kofleriaceae bacterium]
MTRLTTVAACLAASALAGTAHAESQAEIAEKLNAEGKTLLFSNKYAEASAKFRLAVARVPEPGYFINLCTSLYHEGKFGEALTACNAVGNNNPSADQRTKADKLTNRIKEEAKAQGITAEALGGGQSPGDPGLDCGATPNDPRCEQSTQPPPDVCRTNPQDPSCGGTQNGGPPQPQPNYAVGRPPTGTGLFMSTTPDNKYTWTLGVELFGGGGSVGQPDYYGSASSGLRVKGDYLLNPATRFGAQAYFQLTHFGQGEMDIANVDTLDIFDFGIAGYKHLCPRSTQRLCLTPLAGVHVAMMSPSGEMNGLGEQVFNYAAFGGRLELGAHYAFGSRFEHVLGVMVGVNLYSRVLSGPDEFSDSISIEGAGLDKGGAAGYVGLGYTYRFRTPLGSSPFITLE